MASSQGENHIVLLALKTKRRTLRRAISTSAAPRAGCCSPDLAFSASSSSMRRMPATKGCMIGPSFSCALDWYFVM